MQLQETVRERCLYDLISQSGGVGDGGLDAKLFFAYLLKLKEDGLKEGDLSESTALKTLLSLTLDLRDALKECTTSKFTIEHTTMWAPAYDFLLEDKAQAK